MRSAELKEYARSFTNMINQLTLSFAQNWDTKKFAQAMLVPLSFYSSVLIDDNETAKQIIKITDTISEKLKDPKNHDEAFSLLISTIRILGEIIAGIEEEIFDITEEEEIEKEIEEEGIVDEISDTEETNIE
jgi:predicted CopG family antitoxin